MFPFSEVRNRIQPQRQEQSASLQTEFCGLELIAFDSSKLNVFAAEVSYCEPHWHPAPELILVLKGAMSF